MLSYGRMTMAQKIFTCTVTFKFVCAIRLGYDMIIKDGSNILTELHEDFGC